MYIHNGTRKEWNTHRVEHTYSGVGHMQWEMEWDMEWDTIESFFADIPLRVCSTPCIPLYMCLTPVPMCSTPWVFHYVCPTPSVSHSICVPLHVCPTSRISHPCMFRATWVPLLVPFGVCVQLPMQVARSECDSETKVEEESGTKAQLLDSLTLQKNS